MIINKITRTAISSVIITICSWLTIPFPIPFTLQLFGIALILFVLGGSNGLLSILLWLALGAVGLPVFSGFKGGFSAFLSPTGGYLLGFIVMALLFWLLTKLKLSPFAAMLCAYIPFTVCGLLGYYLYAGNALPLLVFVPFDFIKLCLSYYIFKKISKPLDKINF